MRGATCAGSGKLKGKLMTHANYAPVCGLYCGSCEFLGDKCKGCGYVAGKPLWTDHIRTKVCPLYDCCRNQRQLEHCGLCEDIPCETFLALRDPNMSDEDFQKSLEQRQRELKRRTEIGTEKWLLEKGDT